MFNWIDLEYIKVLIIGKIYFYIYGFNDLVYALKFFKDKKIFYSFFICGVRDAYYIIFFKSSDIFWIKNLFYFEHNLNDILIWVSFNNLNLQKGFTPSRKVTFTFNREDLKKKKKVDVNLSSFGKFFSYLYFTWSRSNLKNKYFNDYFKRIKKNAKWYWNSRH